MLALMWPVCVLTDFFDSHAISVIAYYLRVADDFSLDAFSIRHLNIIKK